MMTMIMMLMMRLMIMKKIQMIMIMMMSGWSTRDGELRGPVGYDVYSFGYRDIQGKL